MKINCLTFSSLIKMDIGNPNSGYNEDIISTIKKIQFPNGESYPYISGQAIRRMARSRMVDSGFVLSPKDEKSGQGKSPFTTSRDPVKYIDDDLFGFMWAKKQLSRHSPIRVSPAIGLFPYKYDRDLGIQNNFDIKKDHKMYETEVTSNWLTYSVLIELDRIGNGKGEVESGEGDWEISLGERINRIKAALNSFLYLWGGGKQSRLLTDSSPVAISISVQSIKNPIWMGRLRVSDNGVLEEEILTRTMEDNREIIGYSNVGVDSARVRSKKFTDSPKTVLDAAFERITENIWK